MRSTAFQALAVASFLVTAPAATSQGQTNVPERGVELLQVDFIAVSPQGTPITDLRPEEITVRIGGRGRAVRSLQIVTVPAAATSGSADAYESLPPPFRFQCQRRCRTHARHRS